MSQSRKMSFAESLANIAIGYAIAVGAQTLIFPLYGIHMQLHDQLSMGGFFTVVSIVRSYTLRRFFNGGVRKMKSLIKRVIFLLILAIGIPVMGIYHAFRNGKQACVYWWLDMRVEVGSVGGVWRSL